MIFSLIAIWILAIVSLAGYLWLLVLAFKKSTGWGLAVFFIPFVSLYFAVKFWSETKKPFLIHSGASLGLVAVAVLSFFFAVGGAQMGESNVQLSQPVTMPADPQSTLSPEEKMSLVFMEKAIEVMAKLPSDEKQKAVLKVMRKFVTLQKTGFSAEEVRAYRREIETVLNRTDLNKKQRESIEKMLADVRKKERPLVASLKPSVTPDNEVAAVAQTSSTLGEATAASPQALSSKKHSVVGSVSSEMASKEGGDLNAKKVTLPRYRRTSFVQAKNHIGAAVHFIDPRGEEKDCILVKIAERSLHCRKQFSSGSFSFSYEEKEIKSLKILR